MSDISNLLEDDEFELIGEIRPQRDASGQLAEFTPEPPIGGAARHANATGPFGRFSVPGVRPVAGVYVITIDEEVCYVGETSNIERLAGPLGFGIITLGKLAPDGPATNCRLNARLLMAARDERAARLWIRPLNERTQRLLVRDAIKSQQRPAWNMRGADTQTQKSVNRPEPPGFQADSILAPDRAIEPEGPVIRSDERLVSAPSPLLEPAALGFSFISAIEPERSERNELVEDQPHVRFANDMALPLVHFGTGPFCRFKVPQAPPNGGVYAITKGGQIVYIGKCDNLANRYSSTGYGSIQPRNCFSGGQSTNCRINHFILLETKAAKRIELWFVRLEDHELRSQFEVALIRRLRPPWNRQEVEAAPR